MVRLRGAPLLRPFLICGFLGLSFIASFSRIQGYKNHWVDVWVGYLFGFVMAFYLALNVNFFHEMYRITERQTASEVGLDRGARVAPFFSWFKLPRARAPSLKASTYSDYTNEGSPTPLNERRRNGAMADFEVTTTTETYERTIAPPQFPAPQPLKTTF